LDRHGDLDAIDDPRTAQQLGTLASLPTVAVAALIAYNVIHRRVVSAALDPERLITTKS